MPKLTSPEGRWFIYRTKANPAMARAAPPAILPLTLTAAPVKVEAAAAPVEVALEVSEAETAAAVVEPAVLLLLLVLGAASPFTMLVQVEPTSYATVVGTAQVDAPELKVALYLV